MTLVVPYAAGGGTDITARAFVQPFEPELGQTVIVDNRGGAAGHVGSVGVARARPDGTTLLFAGATNVNTTIHPAAAARGQLRRSSKPPSRAKGPIQMGSKGKYA